MSARRTQRGYTVVEVMMALAVLSIGATGVIAMQKATLLGTTNARDLATATAIASSWLERLRVDGLRWRADPTSNLSSMNTPQGPVWLSVVQNDFPNVVNPEGVWIAPSTAANASGTPAGSWLLAQNGSDVVGADNGNNVEQGFCTNIRITQLLPNLIRAEVRVYWLKNHGTNASDQTAGTMGGVAVCSDAGAYIAALNSDAALSHYHFVYMTTAIARNDSPQ
jgi:prepilin-type N-terminal cleavage/methylation domain-containing protein